MKEQAISDNELRMTVQEVVNECAIPPRKAGEPLSDDMRLVNLGVDSLGVVMLLLELSTRTGLTFERRNGMAPLRTVGDIIDFGQQLIHGTDTSQVEVASGR
jgi:acyl carrier protein